MDLGTCMHGVLSYDWGCVAEDFELVGARGGEMW